jgi:hypothetical protein
MDKKEADEVGRKFHRLAMRLMAKREQNQSWNRADLKAILDLGDEVVKQNQDNVAFNEMRLLDEEGRYVEAIRYVDRCLSKNPDFVSLRERMGTLVGRTNTALQSMILSGESPHEAVALFETLLEYGEVSFQNLVLMVDHYRSVGFEEKSEQLRKRILAIAPHHPALQ